MTDTTLRWGILGTAEISRETIRGLRTGGAGELRAVASRDADKARAWAREHDIPLAFSSYDELLRSGEVDVIYNPLPNSLHATWTINALAAGLHVLCEKPLTVDAAQARAVARAAARAGRCVAEGFMYRHHPQWARVRELLNDGAIGEVRTLHSVFTWYNDDPRANPVSVELAGGALRDVGCYCVHFSRLIVGDEPLRVSAFERRAGVDLAMLGLLEFPAGVLASFETGLDSFERHGARIAGTRGEIVIEQPWVPGDRPARLQLLREGKDAEEIVIAPADSYRLQAEAFAALCRGEGDADAALADAVANMTVLDALFTAAREGRAVAV
ncbi:MAG TPA: Gfo/Idh/MocA family oxidoreductase [bacterium]|nr:Gfo/Idh/MocA family oxidoreductase [bacterium]